MDTCSQHSFLHFYKCILKDRNKFLPCVNWRLINKQYHFQTLKCQRNCKCQSTILQGNFPLHANLAPRKKYASKANTDNKKMVLKTASLWSSDCMCCARKSPQTDSKYLISITWCLLFFLRYVSSLDTKAVSACWHFLFEYYGCVSCLINPLF